MQRSIAQLCQAGEGRRAVTLIEILVTIGILSLLAALLLPAVQRGREAASRAECANNLKQLGIALHAYQANHSLFPPSHGAGLFFGTKLSLRDYSMHSKLLPFIEQTSVYNSINFLSEPSSVDNRTAMASRIALFLCPSDSFEFSVSYASPNSYRANHGTSPYPTWASSSPEGGNGAFRVAPPCLSTVDFTDGLEQTAALSEKRRGDGDDRHFSAETDGFLLPGGSVPPPETIRSWCQSVSSAVVPHFSDAGLTWFLAGPRNTWYNHVETPNAAMPDCAVLITLPETGIFTARSQHPGGVNVLFASGKVRFVSQHVDLNIWRALGTRNGNESVDAQKF